MHNNKQETTLLEVVDDLRNDILQRHFNIGLSVWFLHIIANLSRDLCFNELLETHLFIANIVDCYRSLGFCI